MSEFEKELEAMKEASVLASKKVMEIYKAGFNVMTKIDKSFVTDADLASDKILREYLSSRFPEYGWLSEEEADDKSRLTKRLLFVVDPLDGTNDFVNKRDSFAINVALVYDGHPVASVVSAPCQKKYAYALKGQGSYYVDYDGKGEKLHVSSKTKDLILAESLSFLLPEEEAVLERHKDIVKGMVRMGAATKAIALAKGEVDASVRYTKNTKEWDVCAPELIVTEAGGIFTDSKLIPFTYNREDVYNHDGYSMFNRIENTILLK